MRYFIHALVIMIFSAGTAIAVENQCVVCHSRISESSADHPSHSMAEWQKSVHAQHQVSCDACHGGNPREARKEAAHVGILGSTDPQSRVYFEKISETCGACHANELEGFRSSVHFKALQTSGRGPNCVTCHGSMATRVMSPRDMDAVCTLCHRRPTKAYAGLISLQNASNLLDETQKKIAAAKTAGIDVTAQSAALLEARKSYQESLKTWHTFDTEKVLSLTQGLNQRLHNTVHEIELKKGKK